MRMAYTVVAAGVLLGGCASKTRTGRATVPAHSLQPVMQRQVMNAVDAGEGNPRVRELRAKIAAHPRDVEVRIALAEEYARSGYPELELEHLRLAQERFPASEAAILAASRALVHADQAAEAISRLDAYLAKNEKPAAAVLSWAGIARDQLEQWKEAEVFHRRAVDRSPSRDALHNNLGYNLMMQGRKADAADEFLRALDLNPASETARNNLGLALGDQPAAAITQFRQTSSLAVAHNNMAAYLYEQGDLAGARKELELALRYRQDMPKIMENLRKISVLDGKPIRLQTPETHSFWKTFARGLKHTFVSGEERQSAASVQADR